MASDKLEIKLDRIESKIDIIKDETSKIHGVLAGQAVEISTHIRRTDLLEDAFKPVQKTVHMAEGIAKFIGLLGVGGLLAFLIKHFWY